jgi:[ribosomal protein S5]-alanine N-acetyltransferase
MTLYAHVLDVSEAARLLVDYLFSTEIVERLQATTTPGNLASQRVLEKPSFKKEGVLRHAYFVNGRHEDALMFSLLREEWDAPGRPKT